MVALQRGVQLGHAFARARVGCEREARVKVAQQLDGAILEVVDLALQPRLGEGDPPLLPACECEMRDGLQIENRFFSIAPAGAKASESRSGVRPGVRLAYLGSQGNGHATVLADDTWAAGWSDLLGGVRRACDAGACTPGAIRADNARFVASRLAPLKPDIIVFGPGPWMRADMAATAALLRAMRGTLAPGGRAIFRTCPRGSTQGAGHQGCSNTGSCDETFRALLAETGWEALDIFALTDSLWAALSLARTNASRPSTVYADRYHFHADIYREWNRALLRLLGGSTRARRLEGGRAG